MPAVFCFPCFEMGSPTVSVVMNACMSWIFKTTALRFEKNCPKIKNLVLKWRFHAKNVRRSQLNGTIFATSAKFTILCTIYLFVTSMVSQSICGCKVWGCVSLTSGFSLFLRLFGLSVTWLAPMSFRIEESGWSLVDHDRQKIRFPIQNDSDTWPIKTRTHLKFI